MSWIPDNVSYLYHVQEIISFLLTQLKVITYFKLDELHEISYSIVPVYIHYKDLKYINTQ